MLYTIIYSFDDISNIFIISIIKGFIVNLPKFLYVDECNYTTVIMCCQKLNYTKKKTDLKIYHILFFFVFDIMNCN